MAWESNNTDKRFVSSLTSIVSLELLLIELSIALDVLMTTLLRRKWFMFISTVTIWMSISLLFFHFNKITLGPFEMKKVLKIPTESLNNTNCTNSLSKTLIHNGIYPRRTNLTNILYDTNNIPHNNISSPLFITMADIFYLPAVRNFHFQLKNYDLQNNFIVMCLDKECVKVCEANGILAWQDFVNMSVARVKFDAIVDLSEAGFDFVIFDVDVFLSPSHHPLTSMSDFTDLSWDIQFQLDAYGGGVNIGWFWARPTMQTIDYFKQSKQKWESSGEWDQAVMNQVYIAQEQLRKQDNTIKTVSIRPLDLAKFINFMLTSWYRDLWPAAAMSTHFYTLNDDIRYEMIQNASETTVMWHYTCVEKPLKMFFAKYFGQWTNLDEYYTRQRKFLSAINLGNSSNNDTILLIEFLVAVKLALISERTLIFPDTVSHPSVGKYPGVRTFSVHEIDLLGIDYVEPTFLYHRKFKHHINVSSEFRFHFSSINNETVANLSTRLAKELVSSLKTKELVVLDFSQFQAFNELMEIQNFDEWWRKEVPINDKLNMNISTIRLCRNKDHNVFACLWICA